MNVNANKEAKPAESEEIGTISAEVAKLRGELAGMAETVGRAARDRAEAVTSSQAVTQSLAAGEAAVADLTAELRKIEQDITASTRRSPWRALGIAALFGFAFGVFLRR